MRDLSKIATTRVDVPKKYYDDPRGRYTSHWRALVTPCDTAEVQGVLAYARENVVPIVPYGGGTGLVGGQLFPVEKGAICLSMENFKDIEIDGDTVLVGAGVILDELHAALEGTGRHFPLRLASSGSAQIGGLISTNAGGVNVIRWGTMGELVRGLSVVLPDGTLIDRTSDLRKDNTGFQLDRITIGAEGTLGVITHARLLTVPHDESRAVIMASVEHPAAAIETLEKLRHAPAAISAFELISGEGLKFREAAGMTPAPFGTPAWSVLIDLGGHGDDVDASLGVIADALPDAVLAQGERQIDELWLIRETIPYANRHIGAIASHDISLPLGAIPRFLHDCARALPENLRINAFGHLGDGNLHYNLFPIEGLSKQDYVAAPLSDIVHQMVADMGGSISAEHGIGRYKAEMMARYGLAEKQAAMWRVKQSLDPDNILNPGVFFSEKQFTAK